MKKNKAMNFSLNCPPFNAGIACRAFAAFALGGLLLMAPSVAFADGMAVSYTHLTLPTILRV